MITKGKGTACAALAALAMLCGCHKEARVVERTAGAVGFEADGSALVTKTAPVTGLSGIDDFGAIAYTGTAAGAISDLYASEQVTKNADGYWYPAKDIYWPGEGKYIQFYCYSPYYTSAKSGGYISVSNREVTLDQPTAIGSQVDLLAGTSEVMDGNMKDNIDDRKYGKTHVRVPFTHALAAVRFYVQTADGDHAPLKKEDGTAFSIVFHGATVEGVYGKGTLDLTKVGSEVGGVWTPTVPFSAWKKEDGSIRSYTVGSQAGSGIAYADQTEEEMEGLWYKPLPANQTLLMIPQELPSSAKLYIYASDEGYGIDGKTTKITVDLGGKTWEPNKQYIYRIAHTGASYQIDVVTVEDMGAAPSLADTEIFSAYDETK